MNIKRLLIALSVVFLATLITARAAAPSGWTTDYDKALARAKQEGKPMLLLFTGSDWCHYCIELDKKVLSKKAFKDFAAANLVLVYLDFPNGKRLTKSLQKQNDELQKKYQVKGYPTPLLVNGDEKVLGRINHGAETPEAFVADIEKVKGGAPAQ